MRVRGRKRVFKSIYKKKLPPIHCGRAPTLLSHISLSHIRLCFTSFSCCCIISHHEIIDYYNFSSSFCASPLTLLFFRIFLLRFFGVVEHRKNIDSKNRYVQCGWWHIHTMVEFHSTDGALCFLPHTVRQTVVLYKEWEREWEQRNESTSWIMCHTYNR